MDTYAQGASDARGLGSAATPLGEGRLGVKASPHLVRYVNKVELDDELVALDEYVQTDLAHALMLTQEGVFGLAHGCALVSALLDLLSGDTIALLEPSPDWGTLGLQIERYLERTCGPEGRDIQRARSRIDQKATNWRLINRRRLTQVIGELLDLGEEMLSAAERHNGNVVPGYTHLQHSQPTTFDHYLNAHYWTLTRNLDRLFDAYDRLNVSPLGGAAYSGTSWPINRATTAHYLGFDSPVPNARDAGMASLDMGAELAGVLALTLSGMSRIAGDLNYWASSEVGLIRIAASLSGTSSMMPQKRNPIVLERIRGLAGTASGWAASQLGLMHTAVSTDVDQAYVENPIPKYCDELGGAITLLREVIATLEVDVDGMRASAGRHWATASALADALVETRGMSFREAHESVAKLVATHEHDGEAARFETDANLHGIDSVQLNRILDPRIFVDTRISEGGTGPAARAALADAARKNLDLQRERLASRREQVHAGRERLVADARSLSSHHF
ncbi:MAG: argininosuccinate lyase [Actinomycetota bacterium]|nr:argininosuccinate lyase [Actinomycetota bacterium]